MLYITIIQLRRFCNVFQKMGLCFDNQKYYNSFVDTNLCVSMRSLQHIWFDLTILFLRWGQEQKRTYTKADRFIYYVAIGPQTILQYIELTLGRVSYYHTSARLASNLLYLSYFVVDITIYTTNISIYEMNCFVIQRRLQSQETNTLNEWKVNLVGRQLFCNTRYIQTNKYEMRFLRQYLLSNFEPNNVGKIIETNVRKDKIYNIT